MVSPSRSGTSRQPREDAGKLFVGALIPLGLVASVFLIFSSSVQLVRVGLVAALWAAAIGALAATRYRREAAVDKAKAQDLRTVYELQLEREITARREYELGVEARVRKEVGAEAEEMTALRTELTVLRESLQRLFEGDLPMDRPALRADAVRIQELPCADPERSINVANDNSMDADSWDAWSSPNYFSAVTPIFSPDHPAPPVFASPDDDPVTAETAVVSDNYADEEYDDRCATYAGEFGYDSVDDTEPAYRTAFVDYDTDPGYAAVVYGYDGHHPHVDYGQGVEFAGPDPSDDRVDEVPIRLAAHPTSPVGTGSRRRRRVDPENEDYPGRKLSVAEIMANLRSEKNGR